jgi:hypothetical protein
MTIALAAGSLVLIGAGRMNAQEMAYYGAPPAGACYSPPVVYAPAPSVSYYYAPSVAYYAPVPAVSYYSPHVSYYAPTVSYYPAASYYAAPTAVTTTRYGLFGRPRVTTTYYAPTYVGP